MADVSDRPWYIGLLLGGAGWLAGLFLLLFVFAIARPESAPALLMLGFMLLGGAFALFATDRDGVFTSQLALALSIAGQFAVLAGMYKLLFNNAKSVTGIAFVALVLQLVLVAAMPNRLHRTMSTLFACMAWAVFVRYGLWDAPGGGRGGMPGPTLMLALLGWLVVWLPVAGALYALIHAEDEWTEAGRGALFRPIMVGLIAGLALATLLSQPFDSFAWWSDAPDRRNWLALWPLLSALASLGALAAAFAIASRGLMAVCVVAALLHVSHFYYAMGTSLLVKSMIMLAMGAAFLGAAHSLKRSDAP